MTKGIFPRWGAAFWQIWSVLTGYSVGDPNLKLSKAGTKDIFTTVKRVHFQNIMKIGPETYPENHIKF
jgi:hypothetical protein